LEKFHHLTNRKEKKRGEATSSLQRIFGGKNPLNWPQIGKKKKKKACNRHI
jgi:hypothetical protein